MATVSIRDEVTELLQELIRVDTTNPPGNETAAAELLRDYLQASGAEVELYARVPERANLVARIRGRGDGPTLLFLSHTDVVLADAAEWSADPFGGELREGEVWGRGALDMKGQVAASAVALASLAREGFERLQLVVGIAEDGAHDRLLLSRCLFRQQARVDDDVADRRNDVPLLRSADHRRGQRQRQQGLDHFGEELPDPPRLFERILRSRRPRTRHCLEQRLDLRSESLFRHVLAERGDQRRRLHERVVRNSRHRRVTTASAQT